MTHGLRDPELASELLSHANQLATTTRGANVLTDVRLTFDINREIHVTLERTITNLESLAARRQDGKPFNRAVITYGNDAHALTVGGGIIAQTVAGATKPDSLAALLQASKFLSVTPE